jgi:flagellar export protein FliJ
MGTRRFPLEAVLRLRERREEERQTALGVAVRRLEEERRVLAALESEREDVLRRMADEQSSGRLDLSSLARYPAYLELLAARVVEQGSLVGQAEAQVLVAQEVLAEATRAVKTVEKLRDDWRETVRAEDLKAAERVLDEVSLARFHRRGPSADAGKSSEVLR